MVTMNKIDKKILELKDQGRMGLMTHLVVGFPSIEKTISYARIMEDSGADFIELQIPFSDPIADGPTIMNACDLALSDGTKVSNAIETMKILSNELSIPLLFMAYYNNIFKYGLERFCKDSRTAGASGLIVPDIPIEEEPNEHFIKTAEKNNLYPIRVLSPASTLERIRKNSRVAKGFIYCTARQGITGVRNEMDPKTVSYLNSVRREINVPIAVGFGISSREHILSLSKHADIAVVGSAIINVINKDYSKAEAKIAEFVRSLLLDT